MNTAVRFQTGRLHRVSGQRRDGEQESNPVELVWWSSHEAVSRNHE